MGTEKARAAVMVEAGKDLEIRRYPVAKPGPGCLRVRVTCCTICGSDLHSWQGRRAAPVPMIPGHEIVGVIDELGPGVERDLCGKPLRVGDRVTWTIMDACGACYFCRDKGLPMKCLRLKKYGHDSCAAPPHFNGGLAEVCHVTPGTAIVRVPDTLPDEVVAPANCTLATAVAGWEAVALEPLEHVLILGAGALGFYAAALAAHRGCREIIVADRHEPRLSLVREFGATRVIPTGGMDDEGLLRIVREATGGFGVDAVMETAGHPPFIPLGLKALRIGGRLVELGCAFAGADIEMDASELIFRRLTLTGIHNYDARHLRQAVDFLEATRDRFPYAKLVTRRVSLDEVNQGLRWAAAGESVRVAVHCREPA